MEKNKKVKFIRKNGRIIPIGLKREDGGVDLRKNRSSSADKNLKALKTVFKKHGRKQTVKEKMKDSFVLGTGLGLLGAQVGAATDIIRNGGKSLKATKIGALSGLLVGAASMFSSSKVISKRKFNKEYGLELANKKRSKKIR